MQFLLREDRLHMVVNMRSSDIWLGVPYDLFTFSMVGRMVGLLMHLDIPQPIVSIVAGSRHMYERNRGEVTDLLVACQARTIPWPRYGLSPNLRNANHAELVEELWRSARMSLDDKTNMTYLIE
jgi:thymidylate synthase